VERISAPPRLAGMNKDKAAVYRQRAEQCRKEAERIRDSHARLARETAEKSWLRMAAQIEFELRERESKNDD
jgi:hypothetical protein